jgi:hypothetical protein
MVAVAELTVVPAVPVTVSERFPFLALLVIVTLSVPIPPAVTALVPVMLGEMPVVPPLAANVTGPANPPIEFTLTA